MGPILAAAAGVLLLVAAILAITRKAKEKPFLSEWAAHTQTAHGHRALIDIPSNPQWALGIGETANLSLPSSHPLQCERYTPTQTP